MEKEDTLPYEEEIGREFSFLLKKGFTYEYTYDKGSDSSCVYIYRFKRGRDFFDFRAVSGGSGGTFVGFVGGEYVFPNLKLRHKKAFRRFQFSHIFRKPTKQELWVFAAELLKAEIKEGVLFGIKVE